ncbi:MAG: uroporphyrinogen decarboxylase [Planctomycetes bacterium]|nr:uroporphyrinogen decarboxylase [Planctomycetota bacterium]
MTRLRYRDAGNVLGLPAARWDSAFLRTCRGERAPHTPVWLMRQAGRYMRHYRERRAGRSFLELCKDSELAAEVTVYAREWLGVDAAIIFSDILVVLEALGLPLTFAAGDGPSLTRPIDDAAAVASLGAPEQSAADLGYVCDAIRATVRALPADIPLIGFCGAPFTLASYAIEGGGSRQFARTKAFMYGQPAAWHRLMERLVDTLIPYLAAQVAAGASALQIFDSWVGCLTRADYAAYVAPHTARLAAAVPPGVPLILFGTGTSHLIDLIAASDADVVGVDHTTDLADAWRRCGGPGRVSVQGNLDPALLLGPRDRLLAQADDVLAAAGGQAGHIFNLGHGILKESEPDAVRALVEHVHAATRH